MSDKLDKKEKKKLLRKRNLRNILIIQHAKQHEAETELLREKEDREKEEKRLKDKREKNKDEDNQVWSARLQMVRNRINGDQRMATERWNRFAGTGDAGGRGR